MISAPLSTSSSPYWTALDQELIEDVLFPTRPIVPLAEEADVLAPSEPFEEQADPTAFLPPFPFDSEIAKEPTMTAESSSTAGSGAARKPKRKRNYNDSTRAKHREVQRRFIVRKKEKMEQEKKYALALEKQVQILKLQSEALALERERSSLLQQCVAGGVDLDSHDMTIFLEEEMETLSQYYTPLQPYESSAILKQTMRYIDGFCPDEAFLNDGVTLAGWNHQSRVEQKTISFRITKEFPQSVASQVFERTGYAMATVEIFSHFFGAGLVIKTKLLQLIDLNTVILYRAIYHPVTKEITRSVELLCRVQRGDSYLILMQSLEGLNIQSFVGTQDSWMRGVVWCQINPKTASSGIGCSIQWTGCVGQCPVESLEHWRNDLVFLVLRYEGRLIAPLVTVAINDESPPKSDVASLDAALCDDTTSAGESTESEDRNSEASPRKSFDKERGVEVDGEGAPSCILDNVSV